MLLEGARDLARVADAAHAAEAAGVEADLAQRLGEARAVEQERGGTAAGRQDRLDPGLRGEPALGGLAREDAGRDHHGRVGRRRAARDRADGDRAVGDLEPLALDLGANAAADVLDAMGGKRRAEAVAKAGDAHAVVRAARAGQARLDRTQVDLDLARIATAFAGAEDPLHLAVGARELDERLVAPGHAQVVQGALVDREERRRGAVLGRHVGDAGALRRRERGGAVAHDLDEGAHDALAAEHLGDREREVHGAHAGAQATGEAQRDDGRHEHGDGLAERGGLGLDAAHAPAEHAQAVGRGGVRVGADERVEAGHGHVALGERVGSDDLAEALHVDPNVVEGARGPLEEREALAVALGLAPLVELGSGGASHVVRNDRVVHHKGARDLRADARGVAAPLDHGVAHGGEVDEHGHAREVLEQHAGGHELDLLALLAREAGLDHAAREPRGLLVGGGPPHAVLEQHHERARQLAGARDARDVIGEPAHPLDLDGPRRARGSHRAVELNVKTHVPSPPSLPRARRGRCCPRRSRRGPG